MARLAEPLISLNDPSLTLPGKQPPERADGLVEWSAIVERYMSSPSIDSDALEENLSKTAVQVGRGVSIATVQWAAGHLPLPPSVRILECAASHLLNAVTTTLENAGQLQSTSYTHVTGLGESTKAFLDLKATSDFIEKALTKRPDASVLIICPSGINRAACVAAAYLLSHNRTATLLSILRRLRQQIGPCILNPAQQEQLIRYASEIGQLGSMAELQQLRMEIEKKERELESKLSIDRENIAALLQEDEEDETSSGGPEEEGLDLLS